MKRYLFSFLALLMLAAMLLGVTGCAKESAALIGTWEGEVNYASYFNQGLQTVIKEDMAQYWTVDDFSLTLVMTFREDGTYSMTVNEEKLDAALARLKDRLGKGLTDYIRDLIEASGADVSVDEFMDGMGVSADGLMDAAFGEDMVTQLIAECTFEGNYEVKDGKLYTSAGLEFDIDENMYETYEVTQNTLTLMSIVSDEDTARLDAELYPITLLRVSE